MARLQKPYDHATDVSGSDGSNGLSSEMNCETALENMQLEKIDVLGEKIQGYRLNGWLPSSVADYVFCIPGVLSEKHLYEFVESGQWKEYYFSLDHKGRTDEAVRSLCDDILSTGSELYTVYAVKGNKVNLISGGVVGPGSENGLDLQAIKKILVIEKYQHMDVGEETFYLLTKVAAAKKPKDIWFAAIHPAVLEKIVPGLRKRGCVFVPVGKRKPDGVNETYAFMWFPGYRKQLESALDYERNEHPGACGILQPYVDTLINLFDYGGVLTTLKNIRQDYKELQYIRNLSVYLDSDISGVAGAASGKDDRFDIDLGKDYRDLLWSLAKKDADSENPEFFDNIFKKLKVNTQHAESVDILVAAGNFLQRHDFLIDIFRQIVDELGKVIIEDLEPEFRDRTVSQANTARSIKNTGAKRDYVQQTA